MKLTQKERRLLLDVIDLHVEGIRDAKRQTTLDPTVGTADQLLDLMSGYDDDLATLTTIREKLK